MFKSSYRFLFEVYVSPEKPLIQGLNRTEVVAKRSLRKIAFSLHYFTKGVHLKKDGNDRTTKTRKSYKRQDPEEVRNVLTSCLDMRSGLLMMIQFTVSKQPGIVREPSYVTKLLRSGIRF